MLVGFHGCKGVGKDTAADFLVARHNFVKLPFAGPLKQAVANLFGISLAQVDKYKDNDGNSIDLVSVILEICGSDGKRMSQYDFSWREFLQRFGTEMGRQTFGQNFWVERWHESFLKHRAVAQSVVVTDVRFPNEAAAIRQLGGMVIQIKREGHEPDGHASEIPLPPSWINQTIYNDGTFEDLRAEVLGCVFGHDK